MANTNLPPLTMAASIEVDGNEVWYQMSSSECDARGLRSYVRDEDADGAIVVLPLNEVSDAPRCDHCGQATPDLETCEDDGDTEQRCSDCVPDEDDGDHYDAPEPDYSDDGPMTTGCYMRRLGRAGY